jgi:hypothetical protein
MRGELKELKEKELEDLKLPLLNLSLEVEEKAVYKVAVLVQHNAKYGILLLGKQISKVPFKDTIKMDKAMV